MILSDQNWELIEKNYFISSPFNYAIIDDFLSEDALKIIRSQLLESYKWRFKNWVSKHLHNNEPSIDEIDLIKVELIEKCPKILNGLQPLTHWALMYHKNTSGNVHADHCSVTVTIWLTPEEYNLNPNSGGLILYDVKRSEDLMPHEHLVGESSMKIVNETTKGNSVTIPYAYNRAVIFDAKTFHSTQQPEFNVTTPEGYRINLSIAFDKLEDHQKSLLPYADELEKRQVNR